jgi:trehalose 6-phosphate phosphatase
VNESDLPKVQRGVNEVAARYRELRSMEGKKVYELQPNIDWDKGKAVLWLLQSLGPENAQARPIYIGDDRTDEDAFRAIEQEGVGVLVTEQPRLTAAHYSLRNPTEAEQFLRELLATLT